MLRPIGAGIGTLTAFTVVNAQHLGLSSRSLLVWLAPTLIGVPVLVAWQRHYRRRFRLATADRGAPAS